MEDEEVENFQLIGLISWLFLSGFQFLFIWGQGEEEKMDVQTVINRASWDGKAKFRKERKLHTKMEMNDGGCFILKRYYSLSRILG